MIFFTCSPFVEGPETPAKTNHVQRTSATTVVCSGIGPETVKSQRIDSESELPGDLRLKEIHTDTFEVNVDDNTQSYYEYETNELDINVKGRLFKSIAFWKEICKSDFIISMILEGYKIPLVNEPNSVFLHNNRSAFENQDFVRKAITELLECGLVREESNRPHVINPLSVSINKTGKQRLILDLRHVNAHVLDNKIKFEDCKIAKQYVTSNSYGFVCDLKKGYHHIDIFPLHQKYLGLSWIFEGKVKYFVFTVLPFGLKSSGYVFTKVLRPLVKQWRKQGIKIVMYLDDGFGLARHERECKINAQIVKSDLIKAGFVPNKDKSFWNPSQNVLWLGFIWDLRQCVLIIPEQKLADLIDLIINVLYNATKVKVRTLAKIAGKIISLTPALGDITQIMTRGLFTVINIRDHWDQTLDINSYESCVTDLLFWKHNVYSLKPINILGKESQHHIFTDASDIAAAGFLEGTDLVTHKTWKTEEKIKSSTWREVKAIELCLSSFAHLLSNCCVSVYTDNMNAVNIVHKGSKVHELQVLAMSIFNICSENNITIFVRWIPREYNDKADTLSRIVDTDDWGISSEFFDFLQNLWGIFTVDRFANFENTKLHRFNSLYWNPKSEGIDAFTCNWANENNWLVPPVSLASKAINHLVECKAAGTLVVPKWPSSPFWPLIFDSNMKYQQYVSDILEFHEVERIFISGNNENSLFAGGKFKGTVLAVKLDATCI